jgi:hypothetical protein
MRIITIPPSRWSLADPGTTGHSLYFPLQDAKPSAAEYRCAGSPSLEPADPALQKKTDRSKGFSAPHYYDSTNKGLLSPVGLPLAYPPSTPPDEEPLY